MTHVQQIMALLLEATRASRLCWKQTSSRTYEATADGHTFLITFKYPLLAMDDGSDADVAEVHVPGLTFTFYNGTEGFDRALQILAASIPERGEGMAWFTTKANDAAVLLRRLIETD